MPYTPNTPNKPLSPSPRELIVIARPEAELRVTGEKVTARKNFDVRFLNELLRKPKRSLRPLFRLSKKLLKRRDDGYRINKDVAPPDLSVYFRFFAPDKELESLAQQLYGHSVIETAYVKPGTVPPVWDTGIIEESAPLELLARARASASTSNFTQVYLDDPPEGIGARSVWEMYPGGDGTGVKIIDIEGAWRFTHEDLYVNQGTLVHGTQNNDAQWRGHGTAVLGVIGGDKNNFGITGVCPGAFVQAVSNITDIIECWGTATAIQYAADHLDPGDIILIELQKPGPNAGFLPNTNQRGYIPVEWWDDNLAAIQYATNKGVIVVEAGGNGQEDLDDQIYDAPSRTPHGPFRDLWHNPFNPANTGSGAIIVGAGAPPRGTHNVTPQVDRSRVVRFSNYGSVFDAQGWGEHVETCGGVGFNPGSQADEDSRYTKFFSGTSSAAAMVAGALGCIQGARKGAELEPLTPQAARELLRRDDLGSPQQADAASLIEERIGSRPDLIKMINEVV